MNLLLISNSTNAGEAYLKYPIQEIAKTLEGIDEVVFVPYAAVTFSYDEYEAPRTQQAQLHPPRKGYRHRWWQHLRTLEEDAGGGSPRHDLPPREGWRALHRLVSR